jgi:hypothetical protein
MTVPFAFANLSGNIALAKLDSNFNTPITIGNTSILLGNTVTTLNNLTLANVTITSGTSNVTNAAAGANTQVQYNNSGVLGASANLTFDGTNLGIGTSSPDAKLDVASGNAEAIRLSSNSYLSAGQGPWIGFDGGPSSTWNLARIQGTRAGAEFQGNLLFFTNNSVSDATAAIERMRLDSSGNLGIGTSSPGEKLQVAGAIRATGAVAANDTGGILAYQGSSTVMLGSWGADASTYGAIQFYQSNSAGTLNRTGMLLDSSGNLRVPVMYATTVTTPRNVFIDSSGNMGGISSVRASKTNITALDTVNWIYQLNPVTFNYRKKDEKGAFLDEFEKEQQFGLIAEDVETVKPELCIYVDDNLQGVHYDRMIAPLIKAIQEQQALIQSLTDRIAQLEAK